MMAINQDYELKRENREISMHLSQRMAVPKDKIEEIQKFGSFLRSSSNVQSNKTGNVRTRIT